MNRIYKALIVLLMVALLGITGCQNAVEEKNLHEEGGQEVSNKDQLFDELKQVVELYRDIYEQALVDDKTLPAELKREIVECLGAKGYVVSDNENLFNMQNAEEIEAFVEKTREKECDEVTFYLVMDNGGLVRYDLCTESGEIDAVRSSILWNDGELQSGVYEEFEVQRWEYTEKGYLFLEQYLPEGYDGAPGQIGIRVKALEENLRELNSKYVMPVGYGCNNLLITDWETGNYGELDFYDLFEIMYRMKYGTPFADNGGVEAVEYWIPAEEFEIVLQSYLEVTPEELRKKVYFDEDKGMYRYRPRTMDDMEMPYGPEPEVVACEKQADGTLKLMVEAVWIREFTDCVVTSELVVRPMADGNFRYISNHVIKVEDGVGLSWRKERLTDDEWEALCDN